jgi:hypothetical protein
MSEEEKIEEMVRSMRTRHSVERRALRDQQEALEKKKKGQFTDAKAKELYEQALEKQQLAEEYEKYYEQGRVVFEGQEEADENLERVQAFADQTLQRAKIGVIIEGEVTEKYRWNPATQKNEWEENTRGKTFQWNPRTKKNEWM